MAPQINLSLFSCISKKANIFIFTDFLPQIFTSHGSLCDVVYIISRLSFEFNAYEKSLKTPLTMFYLDLISLLIHKYTVNVVLPRPESTPNTLPLHTQKDLSR